MALATLYDCRNLQWGPLSHHYGYLTQERGFRCGYMKNITVQCSWVHGHLHHCSLRWRTGYPASESSLSLSGLLNEETMGINNTEVVFVLHLNNLSINWGRLEGQEVKEGPWWAKGRTAIGRWRHHADRCHHKLMQGCSAWHGDPWYEGTPDVKSLLSSFNHHLSFSSGTASACVSSASVSALWPILVMWRRNDVALKALFHWLRAKFFWICSLTDPWMSLSRAVSPEILQNIRQMMLIFSHLVTLRHLLDHCRRND